MVTEDYVSFEIAKLLKEKGFNLSEFHGKWAINYDNIHRDEDVPEGEIIITEWHYPLITLQMAMKWLREVHNIFIGVNTVIDSDKIWGYEVFVQKQEVPIPSRVQWDWFNTYEEACEAAIKHCLKNLISYDK